MLRAVALQRISVMMEYGVENVDPKPLTLKQLKSNLRETLRKSGVLDTVKAQVRNEFIHGLGTKSVKDRSNSVIGNDIRERFTHSLVYHLMKNRDLKNSISVYLAECGLDPKNYLLAEKDLIQLVKFNRVVATYQDIHTKTDHEAADSIYSKDVIVSTELVKKNRTTALDFLVHFCLTINGDGSKEIETQTDMSGPSIREQLELDVRKMRDNYNETKDNEVLNPARTIEEKMIRYQRECEERLAVDVRLQVANIRENEIAKVKLEESQKARLAMEAYRKEVDDEYQHRLRSHIERETESSRRYLIIIDRFFGLFYLIVNS